MAIPYLCTYKTADRPGGYLVPTVAAPNLREISDLTRADLIRNFVMWIASFGVAYFRESTSSRTDRGTSRSNSANDQKETRNPALIILPSSGAHGVIESRAA
jgi:hypothetical protein